MCDEEIEVSATEKRGGHAAEPSLSRGEKQRAAALLRKVTRRRIERKRAIAARTIAWTWWRRQRGIKAPLQRPIPRCRWGHALAPESEFTKQAEYADRVIEFYKIYVKIFTKMNRGVPPLVGDCFAGEGGVSAGIERLGCTPVGMDLEFMERYVAKFGAAAFVRGSAIEGNLLERLGKLAVC